MNDNCKNCKVQSVNSMSYCPACGAKVIRARMTSKRLWSDFATQFFGWDNKFLTTLSALIAKPDKILNEYISGTRKKYLSPFLFLAIGTALSMLILNGFSDQYIDLSTSLTEQQFELIQSKIVDPSKDVEAERKQYLEDNQAAQKSMLKYFNVLTFLFLPLYAFVSKLVFGKPHNYAEHVVINCYLQGVSFILNMLFFLVSLLTNNPIYFTLSILASVFYYLYAYSKLNQYKIGKSILKLLKFLGIILLVMLCFFGAGYLSSYIMPND